jgi:hypothetical protein
VRSSCANASAGAAEKLAGAAGSILRRGSRNAASFFHRCKQFHKIGVHARRRAQEIRRS